MPIVKDLTAPFGLFAVGAISLAAIATGFAVLRAEDDALDSEVEWIQDDIDAYWDRQSRTAGFDYDEPHKVEYYTTEYDTPCGETIANNAFYCSADHSIYLHQPFLEEQAASAGRYAPAYILAHEWGHLVQDDLGILESPNFSIQVELQADCFAGAYTADLDARDERFQDEDLVAATTTLIEVGDPEHYPWFAPGAHGTSDQRVNAFEAGYNGGFEACTAPPFAQER